jgi:O-antigen/teichoic acid export membrane protein
MLFRNTLAQTTGLVIGFVFSFLLAPIMISRLGLDKFGVWAVTGAFAAYAGLFDLGIGRSLIRFTAIFDADRRLDRIRQCVGLGLIAVTLVGLLALGAVALAAPLLSDKLGVLDTGEMRIVGMASVAMLSLNGYQDVLNSVGLGKRQMVPPNVAISIGAAINFTLSVAALIVSDSLVVYALANVVAGVLALVPTYFAMRRVWARPYLAMPSRGLVREMLGFSVKDQIGWVAELVNFQTDKIVIALAVDIRAAAIYEIASRVVMGVRAVAIMSVSAMVATAAARIVEEGREVIGSMFRRYTRLSCAVSFPLFVVASVTAPFLLVAWLGDAPGDSELLVPFLTLAFMFNVSTGAGATIATGAGEPGVVAVNNVLIAALNIAFTVALAPFFGIWGVVIGTFLALIVGSLRFTKRFLEMFQLPWSDFVGGVLPTAALSFALAIPSALLAIYFGTPDGRPAAIVLLGIGSLLYLIPYWLLASRLEYLPEKLRFPRSRAAAPGEGLA